MILSLVIEAFKLSFIVGCALVFLIAAVNIFHIIVTRLLPLPILFFVGLFSLIHMSLLKLTFQESKSKR